MIIFPMTVNEISFLRLQQSMILPMQLSALDAQAEQLPRCRAVQ